MLSLIGTYGGTCLQNEKVFVTWNVLENACANVPILSLQWFLIQKTYKLYFLQ